MERREAAECRKGRREGKQMMMRIRMKSRTMDKLDMAKQNSNFKENCRKRKGGAVKKIRGKR